MLRRLCVFASIVVLIGSCVSQSPPAATADTPATSDTIEARRLFEENIDAIHKRDRARYLAAYIQSPTLARNGPGDWSSATRTGVQRETRPGPIHWLPRECGLCRWRVELSSAHTAIA